MEGSLPDVTEDFWASFDGSVITMEGSGAVHPGQCDAMPGGEKKCTWLMADRPTWRLADLCDELLVCRQSQRSPRNLAVLPHEPPPAFKRTCEGTFFRISGEFSNLPCVWVLSLVCFGQQHVQRDACNVDQRSQGIGQEMDIVVQRTGHTSCADPQYVASRLPLCLEYASRACS